MTGAFVPRGNSIHYLCTLFYRHRPHCSQCTTTPAAIEDWVTADVKTFVTAPRSQHIQLLKTRGRLLLWSFYCHRKCTIFNSRVHNLSFKWTRQSSVSWSVLNMVESDRTVRSSRMWAVRSQRQPTSSSNKQLTLTIPVCCDLLFLWNRTCAVHSVS